MQNSYCIFVSACKPAFNKPEYSLDIIHARRHSCCVVKKQYETDNIFSRLITMQAENYDVKRLELRKVKEKDLK